MALTSGGAAACCVSVSVFGRRLSVPNRRLGGLLGQVSMLDGRFGRNSNYRRRQLRGRRRVWSRPDWAQARADGFFGVLCRKQPERSNGSTHATILAGNFIPLTPSRFLHSPAEDAGVPSPWRREEFATGTPCHGLSLIVLRCCRDATEGFDKSWPAQCRCRRFWW